MFGLLLAMSDAPPPSEAVAAELPTKIAERLRAQLAEDAAKGRDPAAAGAGAASPAADRPLAELFALYRERRGPALLRKAIENTIYEFYDLRDHGLFVEDVARVLDLFRASRGGTDDIKSFVKGLAALSSNTAKFMLGLFPEQLSLIYKISRREAEQPEIDEALEAFGPRAMWKRTFAILKSLIQNEKRLRLAITLWARLHGVDAAREHVLGLDRWLAVKDVKELIRRALERKEARAALIAMRRARAAEIGAIEDAL